MSKHKVLALLVSGAIMVALGISCIPNIGSAFNLLGLLNAATTTGS